MPAVMHHNIIIWWRRIATVCRPSDSGQRAVGVPAAGGRHSRRGAGGQHRHGVVVLLLVVVQQRPVDGGRAAEDLRLRRRCGGRGRVEERRRLRLVDGRSFAGEVGGWYIVRKMFVLCNQNRLAVRPGHSPFGQIDPRVRVDAHQNREQCGRHQAGHHHQAEAEQAAVAQAAHRLHVVLVDRVRIEHLHQLDQDLAVGQQFAVQRLDDGRVVHLREQLARFSAGRRD